MLIMVVGGLLIGIGCSSFAGARVANSGGLDIGVVIGGSLVFAI